MATHTAWMCSKPRDSPTMRRKSRPLVVTSSLCAMARRIKAVRRREPAMKVKTTPIAEAMVRPTKK